jgi:hypothetical protein
VVGFVCNLRIQAVHVIAMIARLANQKIAQIFILTTMLAALVEF